MSGSDARGLKIVKRTSAIMFTLVSKAHQGQARTKKYVGHIGSFVCDLIVITKQDSIILSPECLHMCPVLIVITSTVHTLFPSTEYTIHSCCIIMVAQTV